MDKTKIEDEKSNKNSFINRKCFIITPIDKKGSDLNREAMGIVDHIIKPLCEELLFEKVESAVDFHTGQITTNIIKALHEADFIIANLTDQNPNVMYELALAHAFKKRVIHIVRAGSSVPFDINVHKYIPYINDFEGHNELSVELRKAMSIAMFQDENDIGNPVIDALKTFNVVEKQSSDIDLTTIMNSIQSISRRLDKQSLIIKNMYGDNRKINSVYDKNNLEQQFAYMDESEIFEFVLNNVNNGMSIETIQKKYPSLPNHIIDSVVNYFEMSYNSREGK